MNAIRKTDAITDIKHQFLGHSDPKAEQAAALAGPHGQYQQVKENLLRKVVKDHNNTGFTFIR